MRSALLCQICIGASGPDGNSPVAPTYWFWHPNVGHANASRIFDGYVATVGHGGVLNMNIAPQVNIYKRGKVTSVCLFWGEIETRGTVCAMQSTIRPARCNLREGWRECVSGRVGPAC